MSSMKFIELSHTIEHGMITYEGLPCPKISEYLSREESEKYYTEGTSFQIGKIEMVSNTGTYIDAPFHRHADGKDLSELALNSIANLDGILFRVEPGKRNIEKDVFRNLNLANKAVLIHTGWSKHWGTEKYFEGHPFLTEDAIIYLKNNNVRLVGIDSYNIDDTADGTRPAHTILLGADIPIVEHLCNLDKLPDSNFKFFAVPAKIKNFASFPVRAFAITE